MAEGSRTRAQELADTAAQTAISGASEASRRVFDAWASGVETTLRATFEAENAALQAGISVLEATAAADRTALEQWGTLAREAQDAALEAFRSNLRAARQMGTIGDRR